MTWLEIVDTAVKIGLGTFIGGMFTYLLNKQAFGHAIKKEIILDKRQTLKDVSAKFESTHANVIMLSQEIVREWDAYIREAQKHVKNASAKSDTENKLPQEPDFYKRRFDLEGKILLELYSLQGVLMLYGLKEMSAIVYEYTENIKSISPRYNKWDSPNSVPDANKMKKFYDLRIKFYEAANSYLRSASQ